MQLVLTLLFVLLLIITLLLSAAEPAHQIAPIMQVVTVIVRGDTGISWAVALFRRGGRRTPRSQITEIERLYFRAMREMLSEIAQLSAGH